MRLFFFGGLCLVVVTVVATLLFILFCVGPPRRPEVFALGGAGRSDRATGIAVISQPQAHGAAQGIRPWAGVV